MFAETRLIINFHFLPLKKCCMGTKYGQDGPQKEASWSWCCTYFGAKKPKTNREHIQILKNGKISHASKKYLLCNLSSDSGVAHVRTRLELHLQLQPVDPRAVLTNKIVVFGARFFKPFARVFAYQAASSSRVLADVRLGLIPV